jgi:hypothetical protein
LESFPYLPKNGIIAAFKKFPSNELTSGKFESPGSSAGPALILAAGPRLS